MRGGRKKSRSDETGGKEQMVNKGRCEEEEGRVVGGVGGTWANLLEFLGLWLSFSAAPSIP